jgi:glycosyltransferase involved in cell wall biosynthesis
VVLTSQVGPLAEEYTVSGVTIITSPHLAALESIVELQDYEKVVTAVLNEIDVRSFDLIHSNGIKSFWAIDAAQRCRVPSVWSIRDSESWKSSFAGLAESVAARALECCSYAYRVVFTAKRVRRDWTPADRMNNFEVIDNGLDVAQFERAIAHPARHEARATIGLCDHDVCLLTWSALLDRRSRRDLISAIQQLPEDVARRAFFLIVGSGEANYERVFTELTRELPASRRNRVVLMNEEDGMGVLWNAADVLFCTSRFKYYSRIALQAMAKELPVLASSTFGFAEYVRTKINGITFRQGDLSELVDAIAQIVRRDELRAAFGKNSKHLYTTFDSLEEVRGQYADIYRAAAESSVPPRDPLHWDPKVLLAL